MTYADYWNKEWADTSNTGADRTFGEEVWDASHDQVWSEVFQVVSDNPQMFTGEAVKKLEAGSEAWG